MGDMGEVWAGYREAQQARRAARLGPRTEEILALKRAGFSVRELTPYQFRINGRLDLFPIHRRWHDVKTNTRGSYKAAKDIAIRKLRAPAPASVGSQVVSK